MPYIDAHARQRLADHLPCIGPGELNYLITMRVLQHVKCGNERQTDLVAALVTIIEEYEALHGRSYTTINAVVGVLHCARMELLRRTILCRPEAALLNELAIEYYAKVAAPYEDGKLTENGDLPYAECAEAVRARASWGTRLVMPAHGM